MILTALSLLVHWELQMKELESLILTHILYRRQCGLQPALAGQVEMMKTLKRTKPTKSSLPKGLEARLLHLKQHRSQALRLL